MARGHLKLAREGGTQSDYEATTTTAIRASQESALTNLVARFGEGDASGKQPDPSRSFVGKNHWLGLDRVSGARTGVHSAAAGQAADSPDYLIMIAKNLAAEPQAR